MLLSYFTLKQSEPKLNVKAYTERDVFRILKNHKVYYSEENLPEWVDGYYEVEDGKEFVVINQSISGTEKLRTQLHESTHVILDYPIEDETLKLFRSLAVLQTRADITAEAISLIMIFPFPLLERYLLTGEIPEHLVSYIEERLLILDQYGI